MTSMRQLLSGIGAALVLTAMIMAGCSSIHVETGPKSQEEQRQDNSDQAGNIRSIWANRFNTSSPLENAFHLKTFIDSTADRYLDYGELVLGRWRDENNQRTAELPASAIREMIDRSTTAQKPIFAAYDDVVDLGWQHVRDSAAVLDPESERLLGEMRAKYFDIRKLVFSPTGTMQDYRVGVEDERGGAGGIEPGDGGIAPGPQIGMVQNG